VEFPFFGPKTQSGLAQLDVCVCQLCYVVFI
jgi:hypothetical protein